MNNECAFCRSGADDSNREIVAIDQWSMTIMHPESSRDDHFLVLPRQHFNRLCDMDEASITAVIYAVARVAQAIDFTNQGDEVSIRKSVGPDSGHEAHHVHFHVYARHTENASATPDDTSLSVPAGLRDHSPAPRAPGAIDSPRTSSWCDCFEQADVPPRTDKGTTRRM